MLYTFYILYIKLYITSINIFVLLFTYWNEIWDL